MRLTYCTPLALLLASTGAMAGDILVRLHGQQPQGVLYLALAPGDDAHWPETPLRSAQGNATTLRLRDVPPGRYAIQVFQDIDGDGRLALSRRGIPQEPVGFSGNPSLLTGKPSPRRSRFEHGTADTELTIELHARRGKAAPGT